MSDSSLVTFEAVLPERFRAVPGSPGKTETESVESRLIELDAVSSAASGRATFQFRLILDRSEIDEAEADSLYARCKDGTLITAAGVTYIDFDREADSLEEAIRSAIGDINAAGFRVVRLEMDVDRLAKQPV